MQTNLLWLCSSDKNGFFLRGCLNCELKIRRFFGEKCWRRNLSTHSLGNLSGTHLQWTPPAKNMEIFWQQQNIQEYLWISNNIRQQTKNCHLAIYPGHTCRTRQRPKTWKFSQLCDNSKTRKKNILEYQTTNKGYSGISGNKLYSTISGNKQNTMHNNSTISKQCVKIERQKNRNIICQLPIVQIEVNLD